MSNPAADLPFLEKYLVHPSAFVFAQDVLEVDFPYQVIYSKFNQDIENASSQAVIKYQVPQNIDNYISVVKGCTAYHRSLCNNFSQLDRLDFKTVGLVAYVIQKSSSLQKILCDLFDQNPLDPAHFPTLMEDAKNHLFLKNSLMVLKLLALSGDKFGMEKMEECPAPLY